MEVYIITDCGFDDNSTNGKIYGVYDDFDVAAEALIGIRERYGEDIGIRRFDMNVICKNNGTDVTELALSV